MIFEELRTHYTTIAVISQDPIRNFGTMNAMCEVMGIKYGVTFFGTNSMFLYRLDQDFQPYDLENPFRGAGTRISVQAVEGEMLMNADWRVLNTEKLTDRIASLLEVVK